MKSAGPRLMWALGLALLCVAGRFLPRYETRRVSVRADGTQVGGQLSGESALSATGATVAFSSRATELLPGGVGSNSDIYVRDLRRGALTRVSAAPDGGSGDGSAFCPALSANGRWVAFDSSASNLVPGDGNGTTDIFLHDRKKTATTRVSITSAGTESDGYSSDAALSANGRVVAWASDATNLVPGDANGQQDVFVHDRQQRTTARVSVSTAGMEADSYSESAAISGNGRLVAFASYATNLVADDTNGEEDIFVHDRRTGVTERVSIAAGGAQALGGGSGYPAVSATGRWVAFDSEATNLIAGDTNGEADVFVYDRRRGITTRVSVATGGAQALGASGEPRISADGRYVLFGSAATNLVADDTNGERDVFVHDRRSATTVRVSVATTGAQGNDRSFLIALSGNGRVAAFASDATNMVADDTNAVRDVFVRRW